MKIEIDGLTKAQELALNDLFYEWVRLGQQGSSRWTSFYADGDGDFQPKIKIDGKIPKFSNTVDSKFLWNKITMHNNIKKQDVFCIDFDQYAWILYDRNEKQ